MPRNSPSLPLGLGCGLESPALSSDVRLLWLKSRAAACLLMWWFARCRTLRETSAASCVTGQSSKQKKQTIGVSVWQQKPGPPWKIDPGRNLVKKTTTMAEMVALTVMELPWVTSLYFSVQKTLCSSSDTQSEQTISVTPPFIRTAATHRLGRWENTLVTWLNTWSRPWLTLSPRWPPSAKVTLTFEKNVDSNSTRITSTIEASTLHRADRTLLLLSPRLIGPTRRRLASGWVLVGLFVDVGSLGVLS